MSKYKYQLVLQFAAIEIADFDSLVSFEGHLIDVLRAFAKVDGHDFGYGEFNIFILTDYPVKTFEAAEGLRRSELPTYTPIVAYRELLSEEYIVLWPPGQTEFEIA
jgi:hypothetical protein